MDELKNAACDRAKVAEKKKDYMASWRRNNREHLRQYNKIYRMKKKLCGGGAKDEK